MPGLKIFKRTAAKVDFFVEFLFGFQDIILLNDGFATYSDKSRYLKTCLNFKMIKHKILLRGFLKNFLRK